MSLFKINHQLAASVLVIMLHFRAVITASSNDECQSTLTEERGDVFYRSDAYQKCTWSFARNVTEDSVLFIHLVDLKVENSDGRCSVLLKTPGRFERCHITIPCLFYQTPNSKCTMDDLYQYTKKSGFNFSKLFWNVDDPYPLNVKLRTYNALLNRSFEFHYEYIRCPLDIEDSTTRSGMIKTVYQKTSGPQQTTTEHSDFDGAGFKLDVTSFFIGFGTIFCISAVIVTGLVLKLLAANNDKQKRLEAPIEETSGYENVSNIRQGIQPAGQPSYSNLPGSVCPNQALQENAEGYLTPMDLQTLRARDEYGES